MVVGVYTYSRRNVVFLSLVFIIKCFNHSCCFYSFQVDVYSFGVLLCEMCIRELPEPERREEQVALMTNRALRGLVRRCLGTDPVQRPDMGEVIQNLEQLLPSSQ